VLVTAGEDGTVVLRETNTWRKAREFPGINLSISDYGPILAIHQGKRIQLFDLDAPSDALPASIPLGKTNWVAPLAFSPNGRLAAVDGDSLQLWDPRELTEPVAVYAGSDEFSPHRINRIAFSPDGETVAVDDWRGDLALLDGKTLEILDHKQEEVAWVAWDVVFSPDGHYLVTPCLHHTVKVWDVRDGRLAVHRILEGHTDSALSASFSKQGVLAVGCANGQVKLWDSVTWEERVTLKCHEADQGVDSMDFSPDGNTLVTGGADGTVGIHRAATREEVIEAERKGDDPLSGD
jgi:WD40 repeat protein